MAFILLQRLLGMSCMTLKPQVVLADKPLESLVAAFSNRQRLVLAFVLLGQLLLGSVALEPLGLPFATLEPLVLLAYRKLEPRVTEPLPLASINLKKLLVVRKDRSSSSPIGARSQIAPPGRSGIILSGKSRFTRFDH